MYDLTHLETYTGLHYEFGARHATDEATAKRSQVKHERVAALFQAIKQGRVRFDPSSVVAYRGEEPTPANREKARRDLLEVAKLRSAAGPARPKR